MTAVTAGGILEANPNAGGTVEKAEVDCGFDSANGVACACVVSDLSEDVDTAGLAPDPKEKPFARSAKDSFFAFTSLRESCWIDAVAANDARA